MEKAEAICRKYQALASHLDERARRVWAGTEAEALGYGGVSLVARATGISRRAIHCGLNELKAEDVASADRVRKPGGGRKSATHHHPGLSDKLEHLVQPLTRGAPEYALRSSRKT